jgi:hypothetical protein
MADVQQPGSPAPQAQPAATPVLRVWKRSTPITASRTPQKRFSRRARRLHNSRNPSTTDAEVRSVRPELSGSSGAHFKGCC